MLTDGTSEALKFIDVFGFLMDINAYGFGGAFTTFQEGFVQLIASKISSN